MGEQKKRYQLTQQGSHLASPNILGEFYINNHHYIVICAENHFKTLAEHDLDCSFNPVEDSVMGQLQVDRQHCVIVEVEVEVEVEVDSYPTAATHSDMTIHLTERELQIIQLVAKGHANKQIADRLHISEWTVSTHLRRIFTKLGVDSRAAMVYQCASRLNIPN
jgi:DNA-binding CsgD family transcriptional regulator